MEKIMFTEGLNTNAAKWVKQLNAEKSPFQRTYAGQIKRCGEMARKLRFFKDQISKAGLTPSAKTDAQSDINLDDLEVNLGDLETELIEINANGEKLQRGYNELLEYKLVLQKFCCRGMRNVCLQSYWRHT